MLRAWSNEEQALRVEARLTLLEGDDDLLGEGGIARCRMVDDVETGRSGHGGRLELGPQRRSTSAFVTGLPCPIEYVSALAAKGRSMSDG
jgi:hypothetical protein